MKSFADESARRCHFRADLMSCPGGADYLLRMARMFGTTCRDLGPESFGLPDDLRVAMYAKGW